jgi:Flp pilus assembly protein TadG
MRHRLNARPSRPGAAAVEMACLLPFLLFLAVIAADWARLLHHTISADTCARSGALALSDETTWYQVPGNEARLTPYPAAFCKAGTPALTAAQQTVLETAARKEDPSLPASPNGTVTATWASVTDAGATITVTVSRTFNTISRFPGVPSSQTVSRSVTLKVAPQGTN